nr:PREDICTED: uncharacterized protein LOC102696942 [Lepisosteus oculatus]
MAGLRLEFNTTNQTLSATAIVKQFTAFLAPYTSLGVYTINITNITYYNTTASFFAVNINFVFSNLTVPGGANLTNETYSTIQNSMNELLLIILGTPNYKQFTFPRVNVISMSSVIHANTVYRFTEGDIEMRSSLLNDIFITSAQPSPTTLAPLIRNGRALLFIRLEFNTTKPAPSEAQVLQIANQFIVNAFKSRETYQVTFGNVSYERMSANSFAIILGFSIANLPVTDTFQFRNETYTEVESAVNSLLSNILGQPNSTLFKFPSIDFRNVSSVIRASVVYQFKDGDISGPSGFLNSILILSGDLTTTVAPSPTVLLTSLTATTASKGGFPGWALAIIIPCGIAIILVPLWILLCCLLCGCCAACRRRWHRRRSYHVQYTTRNGLF